MFRCAGAVLLVLSAGPVHAQSAPGPMRPNVVLVLVDDLGWMDLRVQGNERLDTPNIDRLASQGMRFTAAYSAAPVCSPVRASIMTGQAPARHRITNHIPELGQFTPDDAELLPAATLNHLAASHVTLAERLGAAGYATALIGKWHLAGPPGRLGEGRLDAYPEAQGFDLNVGGCALGGPPTYFDPYYIHNLPPRRTGEYLPERLADEAVGFIEDHADEPFFLCLWTYTVHWPIEAPERLVRKYVERMGPGLKDPRYAAMIEAMDTAVGRVLATLGSLGLTERTLVIFTSDNGGYLDATDNGPLREGKGYLFEGGIRVPMIVRWPGVTKPWTLCDTPVISTDLFPTILAAAGLALDPELPCDGEDLGPLLRGTGTLARDALFWHYPNYAWHQSNRPGAAIRSGKWKLIRRFDDESVELYDLESDLEERHDLARKLPERAAAMRERLRAWLVETDAAMPMRREEG